jgi:hypothetical protein
MSLSKTVREMIRNQKGVLECFKDLL